MRQRTVSEFYKELFGFKVYKISVDGGCTCPNRDGTKGTGGCVFCSQSGSGDFSASRELSILQQIKEAKLSVNKKFSRKTDAPKKYIVYFQNFTGTYGESERLIAQFEEAIHAPDVVGIAVATRPDCLSDEILCYFGKLSETFFVQLELGLQTASDKTGVLINRCFTTSEYEMAIFRIHTANPKIHVVTHIIFGLPNEDSKMMLKTVEAACKAKTDGIKITVLYVLYSTVLKKWYDDGEFKCLLKEDYFSLIQRAIAIMPDSIVIHRLTGDPPKKLLVAPQWTANKREVLNDLQKILRQN